MFERTPEILGAQEDAGKAAGKYLEGIGKTDLVTLTREEWTQFIEVICVEYDESYDRRIDPPEIVEKPKPFTNRLPSGPKWNTPSWDAPRGADLDDEIPF